MPDLKLGALAAALIWIFQCAPVATQDATQNRLAADAAFAKPEIYEALEERGVNYAMRIPANNNLEQDIAELLPRPVGRPGKSPLVEYKGAC